MPVVKSAKTVFPLTSAAVDHGASVAEPRCRDTCVFDAATEWHHRRLMTIESDPEVLLELIEVAVTWPELEYSETPTIAPEDWVPFVENHHWADQDRVERIFGLATDIAMNAMRATRRRPRVSDRHVGQVDDAMRVALLDMHGGLRRLQQTSVAAFACLAADHRDLRSAYPLWSPASWHPVDPAFVRGSADRRQRGTADVAEDRPCILGAAPAQSHMHAGPQHVRDRAREVDREANSDTPTRRTGAKNLRRPLL
jgi:hypothetical protein